MRKDNVMFTNGQVYLVLNNSIFYRNLPNLISNILSIYQKTQFYINYREESGFLFKLICSYANSADFCNLIFL